MSQAQTTVAGTKAISESVVEAVADAEGITPVEVTPPLFEVIDPDALDRVFGATEANGRIDGHVTFTYNGYEVYANGEGHVSVEEQGE